MRGTNAARVSNDSAAKQPLPAPHGRRGGAATPSSNILNFFSPEPPPPVAAEAATLTIHDFRERDFEMGWLPLSAVTRFFIFFFFSLDSAERDGELTFSFSSFYPWKLIACVPVTLFNIKSFIAYLFEEHIFPTHVFYFKYWIEYS